MKIASKSDLPWLEELRRVVEREEHPDDADAAERTVQGSRPSLAVFDCLESGSFRIFVAEADHRFEGYASVARIPKADARVGFLDLDQLHVLVDHRRQGHATRLLEVIAEHAGGSGPAGIRLLVDPANASARFCLYEKLGLARRGMSLCEQTRPG
ncbi:GNAT family N-acetyltransferase [Singulisphaera sp. PoT]|uniref:GNAT family N-acetyltransferase n=1 Tax=Singulisphaera sp. PoT TaxID=3411797 RepID=UPI003BF603EE